MLGRLLSVRLRVRGARLSGSRFAYRIGDVALAEMALYRFVLDEVDITEVLLRFLIAVPIAAILLAGLRFVTAGYGRTEDPATSVTPLPDEAERSS